MRRTGLVAAMALVAFAAGGCITPPGYSPPVIASVEVSPSPARPGDTVVFTLDVRDDEAVLGGVTQRIFTPRGIDLDGIGVCSVDAVPSPEDPTDSTVTVSCPVPAYASNGIWGASTTHRVDEDRHVRRVWLMCRSATPFVPLARLRSA